jgi:membrane associated rhomboid family serine protease
MKVTFVIMAVSFAIFLLQVLVQLLTIYIALTPTLALYGMYWQFFTYMFAHASISHLGFNMLALFIFGTVVEGFLGMRRFLMLYFVSGVGSALFHIMLTGISDIPMLGASGAVYAVLTAYAVKYPNNRLIIFPIPIPVKAMYVVIGFIGFSIYAGFTDLFSGIAHFGHLGGIIFGALLMFQWKRKERRGSGPGEFEWIWERW